MTEEFETLIRQLAGDTFEQACAQMAGAPWEYASLDVRFTGDGSFWSKIRVTTVAEANVDLESKNSISIALIELDSQREMLADKWHEMKLLVYPDRRCDIRLNYDANNLEDFFDS